MLQLETLARELVDRLRDNQWVPETVYAQLDAALVELESDRSKSTDQIEEARLCHASDEIEIDEHPLVSVNEEGGVWVQAWIYVPPDADSEGGGDE